MSRTRLCSEFDEAAMVREMVLAEAGGKEIALTKVGRAVGVSKWTARGIFDGRRKDIGGRLSTRIRQAYLDHCRRQLAKAEARLRMAQGLCGNDSFEDFHTAIADLASRIQEAQSRLQGGEQPSVRQDRPHQG